MSAPCPNKDDPRGCYRVRCQLGKVCVEPSLAPVQAEKRSAHFNSRDWHLLITALNEVTGSNAWQGEHFSNDLMTPAVAAIRALYISVQPQAEPRTTGWPPERDDARRVAKKGTP